MNFFSWTFIRGRMKAIRSMMKDKTVSKGKKALVIFGIIYLFLPVDIIPPVLFPFGFLDDLVLWIWIIWHLKDTLDEYWVGEKTVDYSNSFEKKSIIENVDYRVHDDEETDKSDTIRHYDEGKYNDNSAGNSEENSQYNQVNK